MKVTDQAIVAALFSTATNAQAAEIVGLSERQLYARMRTESFQTLYEYARQRIFQTCLERVQSGLLTSVEVMEEIMLDQSVPPQVRLNAAQQYQLSASRFSDAAQAEEERRTVRRLAEYAAASVE